MIQNRRALFRVNLDPLYLPIYDKLCEELGPEWQPFFGYRTMKEQDDLYAQGRTAPGKVVTKAQAGFSAHEWGCGSDWTIFDVDGQPIWMEHSDPRWDDYRDACKMAGSLWGGLFTQFPDFPHNEMALNCSWGDIGRCYLKDGADQAHAMILRQVK